MCEQSPAPHGDQLGITRSAADQRDAGADLIRRLLGDDALLQRLMYRRPDRGGPPMLTAGQHADREAFVFE
jgi:hypothetical protein